MSEAFDPAFRQMDKAFDEADKAFDMADEAFAKLRRKPGVSGSVLPSGLHHYRFSGETFRQRSRLFWRFVKMAFAAFFKGEVTLAVKPTK